jgi:hypothetical protein
MPQYDKSEVQEVIDKQQEAVREYAHPYIPPEQLKASGEARVAGGATADLNENPIRAEYLYDSAYPEGVIIGGIDPARATADQLQGQVAFSYPQVWVDVTSLAKFETARLSPYLVIEVTDVRPMPERVSYVVPGPLGGAGGTIKYFVATLSPERKGVFYTPQLTSDTTLRTYTPSNHKVYYYFTLEPGTKELFMLDMPIDEFPVASRAEHRTRGRSLGPCAAC